MGRRRPQERTENNTESVDARASRGGERRKEEKESKVYLERKSLHGRTRHTHTKSAHALSFDENN